MLLDTGAPRKLPLRWIALLLLGLSAAIEPRPARAQAPSLDAGTRERIEAVEPSVIAWRRDIHEHPELGNREVRTAGLVADHLRSLGLEVRTGVARTGVVGVLHGSRPGPVVLLRADMDALPVTEPTGLPFASTVRSEYGGEEVGVMHACGHDAHTAILMGVAEVLAAMGDDLPGAVKFVFQPAEEGPPAGEDGGAELMVREGILDDPAVDVAFALHMDSLEPAGDVLYRPGGTYASADDFRIVVRGRQTHGAFPWDGTDPIVAAAHVVTALQSIVSREVNLTETAAVVSIGRIRGGVRSNIIPEEVELVGTIRTLDPEVRERLHERVRRIATSVAEGMGATAVVQIPMTRGYPATVNDPDLTARMVPALEAAVGAERVRLRPPLMAGEDFAFIAERVPSVYIGLGGRPAGVSRADAVPHHAPGFFLDESGFGNGVRALAAMALETLRSGPPVPGTRE
jgi:amidohydrolase